MKKFTRILIFLFILSDIFLVGRVLLFGKNFQVLNPRGLIATQEREVMVVAIFLMLIVVIPVFIFAYHVASTYHENNKNKKYTPEWDHNSRLQFFIWVFPSAIICILCVFNWMTAHRLDPHQAIASTVQPITVQVIATRWKWVFIYPDQNIATVNFLEIPENTPINFELSASDTPMNSFWIPQLGGQIYAMSGMATQTHLMASGLGTYRGENAEINGDGYADMTFSVKSVSSNDFTAWISSIKNSSKPALTLTSFNTLAHPSMNVPPTYFSSTQSNLFTTIVMKYMAPGKRMGGM